MLSFENPYALLALPALAVPWLLHRMRQAEFRDQAWGAMRLLEQAVSQSRQRRRIENLILVLIRSIILLLIIIAFANPNFGFSESVSTQSGAPRRYVFLIDNSPSMHRNCENPPVSRAIDSVREELRRNTVADSIEVYLLRGSVAEKYLEGSPAQVDRQLADGEIPLDYRFLDLGSCLRDFIDQHDEETTTGSARVFLLSDFQATTWNPADAGSANSLTNTLVELADEVSLQVVNLSNDLPSENLRIETLQLDSHGLHPGLEGLVKASVRSIGNSPGTTSITLKRNGLPIAERDLEVPASGEAPTLFSVDLPEEGTSFLEAQLATDALVYDNSRSIVADFRNTLRLLIVDGSPNSSASVRGALRAAYAAGLGEAGRPQCRIIEMSAEDLLQGVELTGFDAVLLLQDDLRETELSKRLQRFVLLGGTCLMLAGVPADAAELEQDLETKSADRSRIPSFELIQLPGETPTSFSAEDLSEFFGETSPELRRALQSTFFRAYYQVVSANESDEWTVRLRFSNDVPAILHRTFGRGSIVVITAPLDLSQTNWTLWTSFLPVMQQSLLQALKATKPQQRLIVGQEWRSQYYGTEPIRNLTITTPSGETLAGDEEERDGDIEMVFAHTSEPGLYRVRIECVTRTIDDYFHVSIDPRESQLTSMDAQQFYASFPNLNLVSHQRVNTTDQSRSAPEEHQLNLSRFLFLFVVGLLIVEQCLIHRIYWGVILLLALSFATTTFIIY